MMLDVNAYLLGPIHTNIQSILQGPGASDEKVRKGQFLELNFVGAQGIEACWNLSTNLTILPK